MKSVVRVLFCLAICIIASSSCPAPPAQSEPVAFAAVINAYAVLEQSGYEVFDDVLIGESEYIHFGKELLNKGHQPPPLEYAFFKMNQNDTMVLFVRSDNSAPDIYVKLNGKSKYVLVPEDAPTRYFHLLTDEDEQPVFEFSRGRMDVSEHWFCVINEYGEFVILEKLFTDGFDKENYDEEAGPIYSRLKEVNDEQVAIEEEEYLALLRKYGSTGYGIEDAGTTREIELTWQPIAK